MKNKFHDSHHQPSSFSSKDADLRIKIYRQAWLEGKLKINSERLAEKMMDFEKQLDSPFTDTSTVPVTGKSRQ